MSEPDCEKQEPCGYPQLDCVLGVYITKCEDRIEALTAKNEMLGREVNIARYGQPDFAWSVHVQVMDDLNAKLEKTVELLKEARQDLEEYVTHEWPKEEHPVYERKWERDMELCRRIDATLAEIENSEAVTLGEKT